MRETSDLFFDSSDVEDDAKDGKAPPTVCVIPARGSVDRAAAEHIALVVSRQTPCRAVVATRSTGLTAVADLQAMEEYRDVDTIVIATVGGVDEKQLSLIARRGARTFPQAHHLVLARAQVKSTEPSEREGQDGQGRTHTSIAPIIAALDCAPRRAAREADDAPPAQDMRVAVPLS